MIAARGTGGSMARSTTAKSAGAAVAAANASDAMALKVSVLGFSNPTSLVIFMSNVT
jgi:hypothetical protein